MNLLHRPAACIMSEDVRNSVWMIEDASIPRWQGNVGPERRGADGCVTDVADADVLSPFLLSSG